MDARLYQAALTGNVAFLKVLLQEDERILDRIPKQEESGINETPLHISALLGHFDFARAILLHKPQLASKPNSQGSLPLHLAAAKGHVAIVQELLKVNEKISDMCLALDRQGQTPLHVAAAAGRVQVLSELVNAKPEAMRARTLEGDSVLHLCVKGNHFKALELLLELLVKSANDVNLINFKDSEDNTVLHLATAKKNIQMLKICLRVDGVDVESKNKHGFTALDVLAHSPSERGDIEIVEILENAGCERATDGIGRNEVELMKEIRDNYLIAATVIATVTFTAGFSPPGSVWTEPPPEAPSPSPSSHPKPGTAVMSKKTLFYLFFLSNSIGFLASCTIIILLLRTWITKPVKMTYLRRLLGATMTLAVVAMITAFCLGAALISFRGISIAVMMIGFGVWVLAIFLLAYGHLPIRECISICRAERRGNQPPGTATDVEGGKNI